MIGQFFFWTLILLSSAYICIHYRLWRGLTGLLCPKPQDGEQPISVIIAARNEERNIERLLQSLVEQKYPADKFEVLVVNDRSTDSTPSIVERFRQQHRNIRLITIGSNTSDMPNKKNALRTAIAQSSCDLLAFTDADCIVPKEWLSEISMSFTDDVGAVAGYSPYVEQNRSAFLRYEENKNSLIAASAVELRNAFMCTGRNFAYRKKVFNEVGGFEKIKRSISGDDDLFLQLVQKETSWKIRYMISPNSVVRTIPPESFSHFVSQRTRHISASKFYPITIQSIYAMIHLFHLSIILGLVFLPLPALIALMVKFNVDGAFIASGKHVFTEEFSVPEFIVNETALVLYSFLIAPLGFIMKFDWKGNVGT